MHIRARIETGDGTHRVRVTTGDASKTISIAAKPDGRGSSINGGELLFLALATCFGNDIYRESEAAGVEVRGVEVEVEGDFETVGGPASNIRYRTRVTASGCSEDQVRRLIEHTDRVSEIQNTLRAGTPVVLETADITVNLETDG